MNRIKTYKVLGIRDLTTSAYVIRIERKNFEFIPGQCVNIGLVESGVNREYSTYSGVGDPYLEFLIKEIENGAVSPQLRRLKKGGRVTLDGAYGLFTLTNPEDKRKYLFVGSGTGIAPFHSFVKSYPNLDYTILHGVRTKDEQYDKRDYDPKRYIACVSRGNGGDFYGRVTDYLLANPIDSTTVCYLCGNSDMINDAYDILRGQGLNGSNIITEVFF